jgi:hypothetical protein
MDDYDFYEDEEPVFHDCLQAIQLPLDVQQGSYFRCLLNGEKFCVNAQRPGIRFSMKSYNNFITEGPILNLDSIFHSASKSLSIGFHMDYDFLYSTTVKIKCSYGFSIMLEKVFMNT